jgi:hypothetical protein
VAHGNAGRPRPDRRRRFVLPVGDPRPVHRAPTRSTPAMRLCAVGSASANDDRLLTPRPPSMAPYARLVTRSRVLGRRPVSTRGDVRRIVGPRPGWRVLIVPTIPGPQPRTRMTDSMASLRCGCQKPIAPVTCWFVPGAIVRIVGLVALRLGYLIMSRLAGGWFCWRGRTL